MSSEFKIQTLSGDDFFVYGGYGFGRLIKLIDPYITEQEWEALIPFDEDEGARVNVSYPGQPEEDNDYNATPKVIFTYEQIKQAVEIMILALQRSEGKLDDRDERDRQDHLEVFQDALESLLDNYPVDTRFASYYE